MAGKRILVIDDEADILMLAQLGLEMVNGWEVFTASSPPIGIQMAAQHQPDAILLDMTFPDMDGAEVLRRLQAQESTRHIPVLLVSGNHSAMTQLGAAGVVEKPFDVTRLAEIVSSILNWPMDS